ncbi:uracil phosphoribosyltransferase [Peredibacter starrii]|uniref:Uracil phosphoribosyltransferase n=1 Tax=Peredibacter starrii TaxID=28202 RepID=A0AAX4HT21_9BACT|nr:uracil phosphoribosyltransferase [Peredibacter starrii]WPU66243.1 uracil phosphoribosyltransferase [Peredibacter starrii]
MAKDSQFEHLSFTPSEFKHHYGPNVHLVSSPLMLSLLAKLGRPDTHQPQINELVGMMYSHLIDHVIDQIFPRKFTKVETRMQAHFEGEIVDPSTPCVSVDLARAGTLPSHYCYNKLNYLMDPTGVRQDHFYVARVSDENGQVTGINVSGSKIGGGVDKAIVLFPDPMGATGGTIVEAYEHYKNKVGGTPLKMVALHLIITPEYLAKVTKACPDLEIFALRIDRGLSSEAVLKTEFGKNWKEEKGLNNHQYIVPGAGGLGEILNNSYC